MKCTTFVGALIVVSWATVASAQSCHTAARPSNPAPASQDLRVRIVGDFSLNEEKSRSTRLEAGKGFWISGAGCPRMGRIRVAVVDAGGKTVKSNEGFSPSFCFRPEQSGNYTVKVTALSLNGSNSWGSIDAGLADSQCKN